MRRPVRMDDPMFEVSVSGSFEASHYIDAPSAPDMYRRVHGHSFVVTATAAAEQPTDEGWVIDMGVFGDKLNAILKRLDHQMLNDIAGLERPTFENILVWIDQRLAEEGVTASRLEIARPTVQQRAVYTPKR